MRKLSYSKSLGKLLLILAIFLLFPQNSLQTATSVSAASGVSPDAIAFRVMSNTSHLSPARWYQENIKVKGSLQTLTVDGYQAVREGRTVYVNAANVVDSDNDGNLDQLYTNIYIISYNQAAENATIDIFGQILKHWKFNFNITEAPKKAKIVRDTKRLVDLSDMRLALANYRATHSGYPSLSAGSYLAGKSISVWPSWQATLGAALGVTMPHDPFNKLGDCSGYDATTCWDQQNKKFAGAASADNLTLPSGSYAYYYTIKTDGAYNICAIRETAYTLTNLTTSAEGVVCVGP
jgi:hypothetical protein